MVEHEKAGQYTWEDSQPSLSSRRKVRILNLDFANILQKYEIQFLELFRSLSKSEQQHLDKIVRSLALTNQNRDEYISNRKFVRNTNKS